MTKQGLSLVERDKRVLWHPYTQHGLESPLLPIQSASGAYLKLSNGQEVLDGISSWWVNLHGHSEPRIVRAIQNQASQLEHVLFAGMTHEPAVRLAETLLHYPPIQQAGLARVFYSDNGSTAVEVALKMAFQSHLNQGNKGRDRFLALSNAYHGDTFGAMAVGEPTGFHSPFRKLLPQVDFIAPGDLDALKSALEQKGRQYAGFIFEPLVQGAAGMKMYTADYLKQAVELCQAEQILTICDEVFTGFFRTGKCFAFEYGGIRPDILCLSKGITGGFLPLAVTLASEAVFESFLFKDVRKAFLHGHSYTANPIACAAALESWDILQSSECQYRIQRICETTQESMALFNGHSLVKNVRSLGTIGVVEVIEDLGHDYYTSGLSTLRQFAIERGVFIRPLGNVIYSVPPYCLSPTEVGKIYQTIFDWLQTQS